MLARRTRLLLLVAFGLAVGFFALLLRTPTSTNPEQPPPPPVEEPRKPALQADAEGYYVPSYRFTVNRFQFTGFSLRPEALVTFAQTTAGSSSRRAALRPSSGPIRSISAVTTRRARLQLTVSS